MATKSTHSLVLKGVDKVSRVMDKITRKFPKLRRSVRRTSKVFAILQKRTERFRKSIGKLGRRMRGVGRGMTVGLTAPIGLAGAAILRTGVQFQKSINRVAAVTNTIINGKVTPQFKALEEQALMLGSSTEFSATQAADAMALLGRAGFKTSEILEATDDVLALATASGSELAFTADIMAKTIRAFGLEASDAARVSDVLSDVSRKTNVDLSTLAETFKDAAPIAKAYGATLEQTAAITGLLGDVGIQGSKAGTTLKAIMLKLAAPSKKAALIMKQLGIEVATTAGGMTDVGSILTQLAPALGKFPKQAQLAAINELFGLRGIAGASALMSKAIKEGKNPIATLTKLLEGSSGAAKEMQKIMLRGSVGALARFNSALEGVGLAFSRSGMLEAFADLLELLAGFFSFLSKLNPAILKWIAILGGIVAVIGPILIGIGSFLALLPFMITGMGALSAASLPITGTFLAIAAAIAAIVAIIAVLVVNFDAISDFMDQNPFLSMLKTIFLLLTPLGQIVTVIRLITSAFKSMDAVKNTLKSLLPSFVQKFIFGESAGAETKTKEIAGGRDTTQTNNSIVDVNFKNAPQGTKAVGSGPGIGSLNVGTAGGIQ